MLPALDARPAPDGLAGRALVLAPRALDLGLLVLVLAAGLVDFVMGSAIGAIPVATPVLATVAAGAFVLVRHRAPLAAVLVLAAGIVFYVAVGHGLIFDRFHLRGRDDLLPFTSPQVALGGMSITLIRTAPPRVAAGVAVLLVAVSGLLVTLPDFWLARTVYGAGFAAVGSLAIGAGGYLRFLDHRGKVTADLARRDERLDLARELHDLVAHYVTGIVVQAQAARVVADGDPAAAGAALDKIEAAGRDALTSIRAMVGSLRDDVPVAPPAGLAGLHDLAANARTAALGVDVAIDPAAEAAVTGLLAAAVHRIVQESLTNVRRHAAGARSVRVAVGLDDAEVGGTVVVTVVDDGRLAAASGGGGGAGGPGYGLVGMQERAAAVGGTLRAGPVEPPGRGWMVEARLPLRGATP